MPFEIQILTKSDIDLILDLQKETYSSDLLENSECFLNKIKIFPAGCFGAFLSKKLIGYIFFHPWKIDVQVPLNNNEYFLPENTDCIYIHDIAIDAKHRNQKIGYSLFDEAIKYGNSHNFKNYALTAVQKSETYWERWGYMKQYGATYGESSSIYMICKGLPVWR